MNIIPFEEKYRTQIDTFLKKDTVPHRIIWDQSLNHDSNLPNIFLALENDEIQGILSFFTPFSTEIELYPILKSDVFPNLLEKVQTVIDFSTLERALIVLNGKATTELNFLQKYLSHKPDMEHEMSCSLKETLPVPLPLTIRKGTLEDLDELAVLNANIFEESYQETKNFLKRRVGQDGVQIYIGEMNGKTIGNGTIKTTDERHSLSLFGVIPQLQGKGYGKAFLSLLLNTLLETKTTTVSLDVDSDNVAALRLYKSLGFTIVESEHYYPLN